METKLCLIVRDKSFTYEKNIEWDNENEKYKKKNLSLIHVIFDFIIAMNNEHYFWMKILFVLQLY